MKKTSMILITGMVIIFSNNHTAIAGCGGICITTQQDWHSIGVDSVYLDENGGLVTMYAYYNSCCELTMNTSNPNMQLIWYKDGVPFDTTNIYDVMLISPGMYSTTFTVNTAGLYEVFFINFQGATAACGKVYVLNTEETHSIPTLESTTKPLASLEDEEARIGIRIYPNPTSEGYFNIDHFNV